MCQVTVLYIPIIDLIIFLLSKRTFFLDNRYLKTQTMEMESERGVW